MNAFNESGSEIVTVVMGGVAYWALTRRKFANLLAGPALGLYGQGVSTRNVTPLPRGKPSGLPFHAHFTDIAHAAGLWEPVVCGAVDHKSYIIETVGCGAAFVDYDN